MTPAMEEVARLREKLAESAVPNAQDSRRLTRSRVAKLKRKIIRVACTFVNQNVRDILHIFIKW